MMGKLRNTGTRESTKWRASNNRIANRTQKKGIKIKIKVDINSFTQPRHQFITHVLRNAGVDTLLEISRYGPGQQMDKFIRCLFHVSP